jgi:hypothetical protein
MKSYEEIGRELKVSELKSRTVVWLAKDECAHICTCWVVSVQRECVHFYMGGTGVNFLAKRCGPDMESVTDSTGKEMSIYEYLGEV